MENTATRNRHCLYIAAAAAATAAADAAVTPSMHTCIEVYFKYSMSGIVGLFSTALCG